MCGRYTFRTPWQRLAGVLAEIVLAATIPLLSPEAARSQEKVRLAEEQWFKRVDAKEFAALEETIQKVYAQISASVVRVYAAGERGQRPESIGSGVIVSPVGDVLTCAHLDLSRGTNVIVELADGSRVRGTVLGLVKKPESEGRYRAHDIGLIRLQEKRDWPAVARGSPSDLDNGEMCLAIGYPYVVKPGQPPLLRTVRASCRVLGGDSGGPLFDLHGRVLGVLSSTDSARWPGSSYASIDVFTRFRDRLRSGEEILAERKLAGRPIHRPLYSAGAFEPAEDLASAVGAAHRSVVQVLVDGKPVALGLIVGADGWIVTKRTDLAGCGQIACRLADRRQLAGRPVGGSRDHDLVLLKVEAADLPVGRWAEAGGPRTGQVVASLRPDPRPLHFGVVGGSHVPNPGVKGYLPIDGGPTPKGQTGFWFKEIWKYRPEVSNLRELLKAGDLITRVDDIPTFTGEEYVKVRDERVSAANMLIGERIKLTVRRGKETFQVFVPIVSSELVSELSWKECPLSLRRNGFPDVFTHDGGIAPEECGGPVVGRSGEIVGINIARADEIRTFAIPSAVVRKVVAELKANADKK
jgi:serine protease Do